MAKPPRMVPTLNSAPKRPCASMESLKCSRSLNKIGAADRKGACSRALVNAVQRNKGKNRKIDVRNECRMHRTARRLICWEETRPFRLISRVSGEKCSALDKSYKTCSLERNMGVGCVTRVLPLRYRRWALDTLIACGPGRARLN